jgi:hypothetical protein
MNSDREIIAMAIDPSGWGEWGFHTKSVTAKRELSLKAADRVMELYRQGVVGKDEKVRGISDLNLCATN